MAAGQTLEQLEASVKLDRYRTWANYQRLRAYNVEAAYHNLLLNPPRKVTALQP